jgi:peptidoglycan/LPS O-acetylase OafA/YrhL
LGLRSWVVGISDACGAGLQLFFLLSSYLITELLLRESESTGTIHLSAFYIRRMLRIWPLYFSFVGVCFLISKATSFTILTNPEFVSYLLLAGNWWTASHGFITTIAGPLWSISVEEQYYIVWPFIGRFGLRTGFWAASLLFLLLSTGTLIHLGRTLAPRTAVWCNSLVEFQFFAAGGILALALHGREFTPPAWVRGVFLALAVLCILIAQGGFNIVGEVGVGPASLIAGYGLFTVATVLLFLGFFQAKIPAAAAPFLYLGKISYGLYVFHLPAVRLLFVLGRHHNGLTASLFKIAAAFSLCVAFAMLSYRLLELPFLHVKRRFTLVRNRLD